MISLELFPKINASLNGMAAVLLLAGYIFIRQRRIGPHKAMMVCALVVSVAFLASYITYHTLKQRATGQPHTTFTATGWMTMASTVSLTLAALLATFVFKRRLISVPAGTWIAACAARQQRPNAISRPWGRPSFFVVCPRGCSIRADDGKRSSAPRLLFHQF